MTNIWKGMTHCLYDVLSTHPLAPEELEGGVDVAEVVRPPEHAASLHGQPLPTEDLQQGQQPHSVTEVINQTLNLNKEVITTSLSIVCK